MKLVIERDDMEATVTITEDAIHFESRTGDLEVTMNDFMREAERVLKKDKRRLKLDINDT